MRVWTTFPRTFRLAAVLVAVQMVVYTALRIAFLVVFGSRGSQASPGDLLHAFYVGGKLDLRLAIWICVPLLALGWIRWLDPFSSTLGRRLWSGWFAFAFVTALFAYFVDFGHYGYLETRLNAAVTQYIGDPLVTVRMVWETYPVLPGALALAIVVGGIAVGFGALVRRPALSVPSLLFGWRRALAWVVAWVLAAGGIYGKISWYPLRWSDAFFSDNEFTSALGLNPVLQFFETLSVRKEGDQVARVREHYAEVAAFLGVRDPDAQRVRFERSERPTGVVGGSRPNVVIILLESFATSEVGYFGNPLKPTPVFDSLVAKSTLFTRFYVAAHGTARSVFTLLTGIPDVEGAETSSQNPLLVRQRTIVNAFEGYKKLYFLGGSATWGNIRGLLSHNIPGLVLREEGSFRAPRVDVWGIDDLHLFEEANEQLRDVKEPFFAIIQTSGHHRPYTIPKDSRGFVRTTVPDDQLTRYGFTEQDELNSFRFLDFCLGFYLDQARRESYFGNTIFVMLGDHGLPRIGKHLPPGEAGLALIRFHVPLLVYAPGLLPVGRIVEDVASEVDVLPTVAGLTGTPYTNTTIGRDLFDPRFTASHYAFTMTDQFRVPEVGLLGRDYYLRMPREGGRASLHALGSRDPMRDVAAEHPEVTASMQALCEGLNATVSYMLRHNAPQQPGTGAGSR